MRRILRIGLRVLAVVAIGAVVAIVILLGSPAIPDHSDYQLDIATLRQMADTPTGARPIGVNAAIVGEGMPPAAFFLGGVRFDRHHAVFPSYQVLYPDGMVIIDAPPGGDFYSRSMAGTLHEDQFRAEQRALTIARTIVITHEHADHLGGIAQSPQLADFAGRVVMTREQLESRRWLRVSRFPDNISATMRPLDYDHYYALAPGIVLVKAPGHTVGSQLVYVHLAGGAEYLFIGDVAWDMTQVTTPHCRPRLAELFMSENSDQVTAELRTLHDFAQANSSVHLVVSHDAAQLADYQNAGLIGRSFSLPP
jgi:glyoxylase-like metal-dependent hydrolase (beta-lactamase superfamily II)